MNQQNIIILGTDPFSDGGYWGETIVTALSGTAPDVTPLPFGSGPGDYTSTNVLANLITIVDANTGSNLTTGVNTVIVGQQMNLRCQLNVTNFTATGYQWAVPGYAISNYVVAADSSSAFVATNFPLNHSNVVFYWVDGSPNRVVKCAAMVNGMEVEGQAVFNIVRPSIDWIGAIQGTVAADANYIYEGTAIFPWLHFGGQMDANANPHEGIIFTVTNLISDGHTDGQTFFCTQIANVSTTECTSETNSFNLSGIGVDLNSKSKTFFDFTTNSVGTFQDSPGSLIGSSDIKIHRSDSFDTYLMFQASPPSTPVPIKKISWSWSGTAIPNISQPGYWSLLASNVIINANNENTFNYPVWTNKVGQGHLTTTTTNLCP